MRGVATCTRCRPRKPTLQQALAMNALVVIAHDLVLRASIPYGRLLPFAMAASAQIRHIRRKRHRPRVVLAKNVVGTVAVLTEGRVCIPLGMQLAVHAEHVLLANCLIARLPV